MKVIVLDTETTNTLDDPFCYDIGWAVVDTDNGEIVKAESYMVAEIFLDKDLMSYAYFAEKIPSYWEEYEQGERKLARLDTIRRALYTDCKVYGVNQIYAHNARFDYNSCNTTQRFLTSSKYRYFFPYAVEICDTLKLSRQAFGKDENYRNFCKVNGYTLKNGGNRYTAEVIYRFLTDNTDFEEVHKGLDDVKIEKEILMECLRRGFADGALFE